MKLFRFRNQSPPMPTTMQWGGSSPQTQYLGYSRAYSGNEIVYAAIEMLATSAAEPHFVGRRWQRNSPEIRYEENRLLQAGIPRREVSARMVRNGFYKDLTDHPLIRLVDKPNPWMSRGQIWGNVVMDMSLAGNSYLLKTRAQNGPLQGKVKELWRLRPDRVKVIPSASSFIEAYEYRTGSDVTRYAADDILHFKTRDALNDYYGMPPLMPASGRVDIDDYMKNFLRGFFAGGGATGPTSILSVKQKMSQDAKDEITNNLKDRYARTPGGWIILDNAEAEFTKTGLDRGLRDALPQEIDAMTEARIAMVFGIPASILGLRSGMESSSYANKRQDWQVFWDLKMTPMLSDLDDVLNLGLVPEFGGIDEVMFDLSDIRALQEDVDKIHKRHRDNLAAGLESWEEAREALGFDPNVKEGIFFVPSNYVPTEVDILGEPPEIPAPTPAIAAQMDIVAEVHCPKCGRWVGRNMNVGATAYCPKDKEVPVVMAGESKIISIEVVRDDEGRVAQLVGASE